MYVPGLPDTCVPVSQTSSIQFPQILLVSYFSHAYATVILTLNSNTKLPFSIGLVEMTQKQISKLSLITIVDRYRKTLAACWRTTRKKKKKQYLIMPDLVTRQKGSVCCTFEDSQTFILSFNEMQTNNVKIGYLAHKT